MTIKEFYDQAASNEELKSKIAGLAKSGKGLEDILKELGVEGTAADVKAYADALVGEGKLDKSQLDEVAGGTTPVTLITVIPTVIGTVSIAKC